MKKSLGHVDVQGFLLVWQRNNQAFIPGGTECRTSKILPHPLLKMVF